jgi:hypothetical protein
MDLEWPSDILIQERTITTIIGPPQVVIAGLDSCSGIIRRYPLQYVCSNYSQRFGGLPCVSSNEQSGY